MRIANWITPMALALCLALILMINPMTGTYADTLNENYDGTFTMNIYHTNDQHGHTEMYPKMITTLDEAREEHGDGLLLHAGDVFSGTLYFNEFYGQDSAAFMNEMGYDAFVPGNHEFDLGDAEDGHPELAAFFQAADFPILGANMDFFEDESLGALGLEGVSHEAEDGMIHDGIVLEYKGENIGLFGLTTEKTRHVSSPIDVAFHDYAESAQGMVDQFEAEGIDKIIALTHLGYDDDLFLAQQVEGIDVIVGGHSHTEVDPPTVVTENEDGEAIEPTVVGQAGKHGKNVGWMNVTFDENGDVIEADGELFATEDREPDPKAEEMLEPYQEQVEELQNEEVGATIVNDLPNPRHGGGNEESVRANETALGNLITDGQLAAARKIDEDTMMALQNGGGIRKGMTAGNVTVAETINVLPFVKRLTLLEVSGEELFEAFETSVSDSPKENGGFLHVSDGTRLTYDSVQSPGERVVSLEVEVDGDYERIEADEQYTVATNNFTAAGGDGHEVFAEAYDDGRGTIVDDTDWEMLRDYMEELGEVDYEVEGRIQDITSKGE